MFKKTKTYLFVVILSACLITGGYAIYSILRKALPLGLMKSISAGLELKELDKEILTRDYSRIKGVIDVLHYTINIDMIPAQKKIIGDVDIKIKVSGPKAGQIQLNFYDNLNISRITLNDKEVGYNRKGKVISVKNEYSGLDTINIRVQYSGTPKSLGFGSFNFEEHDNHSFVYTMNEPIFASTWLPCIDIPNDKALMDMYVTNDSCCVSLSNGKLIDIKTNGGKRTYHWKTFYPISTYLIAIYSGNYSSYTQKYLSVNKDQIELTYYGFPNDLDNVKKDCEDHPNYLRVFEELFGPYAFSKEKYSVAEFLWQMGAMEHQTLTGIGYNFISGRKFFKDILIHELAHHWWGNAVGPETWKDIWLNEGFATYSEALYWEKAAGFSALQSTLAAKRGSFTDGKLYEPGNSLFSRLVYDKGAWVLHMLRREVGDKNFFLILRTYFSNFKYGNASTYDFQKLCEKISNTNLKFFFDQWIYKGEGRIELDYEWKVTKQEGAFLFTLHTQQMQKGFYLYKFPLDIKLVYGENDFEVKTVYIRNTEESFNFTLDKNPTSIVIDPEKWLLANFESKNE